MRKGHPHHTWRRPPSYGLYRLLPVTAHTPRTSPVTPSPTHLQLKQLKPPKNQKPKKITAGGAVHRTCEYLAPRIFLNAASPVDLLSLVFLSLPSSPHSPLLLGYPTYIRECLPSSHHPYSTASSLRHPYAATSIPTETHPSHIRTYRPYNPQFQGLTTQFLQIIIMPSTSLSAANNGVQNANDNITRFNPPSRVLSPFQNALFHNKTRCFV